MDMIKTNIKITLIYDPLSIMWLILKTIQIKEGFLCLNGMKNSLSA